MLKDFKTSKGPSKYDEYKSLKNDVKKAVDRAKETKTPQKTIANN